MSNIEKIVRLAARQHGVFAAFQLKSLNVASGSVHHLMRNQLFNRVSHGVYLLNGFTESWHQKALVHVLRAGPQALLSHESALINMKLLGEDFESMRNGMVIPHHATLPRESRRRLSASLHRSIYTKELLSRVVVNHIPQVPAECAIIESARHIPPKIFSSVIDTAIRNQHTTAKKLRKTLAVLRPAPGRSKSRVDEIIRGYLLSAQDYKRTESSLEVRVLRLVEKATRAKIIPQYDVWLSSRRYRIDLAIPSLRIAIEVDGFEFHSDRISFDADKTRQNDLVANGWKVLRFTATQSDSEILAHLSPLLSDGAFKHQNVSV